MSPRTGHALSGLRQEEPPRNRGSVQAWLGDGSPQEPTSRREQIVVALREAIVRGDIPPGAQLKQDDLSDFFGVSPAPVREALRQLASEGLVEHYPNRGAFVADVSTEELLGVLLPVRLVLEQYAFEVTAGRLTDELVRHLQDQVATMAAGARTGDISVINEADVRFHELAVSASGAPQTVQLWRSVLPRIRVQFYRLAPRHETLSEIAEEHQALLTVLQRGDNDALRASLRDHIVGTSYALLESITHG